MPPRSTARRFGLWRWTCPLFLSLCLSFAFQSVSDAGGKKEAEPSEPAEPKPMELEGMDVPAGEHQTSPVPGPKAAPVPEAARVEKKEEKADQRQKRYLSAALKVDCLIPPRDVTTTVAVTVELRYYLPFHENRLSLGAEAGWYGLQGSGKGQDADLGEYRYSYYINNIPIFIGPAYEIPIPGLDKTPFDVFVSGGFAMVVSRSHGIAFGTRSSSGATAMGYYAGAGAEFDIWIGRIVGEVRYTSAFTDYGLPQKGGGNGDLGGVNIYAGYRFVL